MDRQVARDAVTIAGAFDFSALESKRWELFRVEEIGTFEVLIALLIARIE
jgi:hypothetical protein